MASRQSPSPGSDPMHRETLDKLAQFDTPTIANVIELFDVRPRNRGYMDHRIRCAFAELPPMVGLAATAAFRADAPPRGEHVYGSLTEQLEKFAELSGTPVVVFQDQDDPPVAAVFGEVMCSTYKAFGAVGLVTNGAGRDLEQVRRLKFPVFTGSTICSHGYCQTLHVGLPVRVGGLMVYNGDLLHGDANGVTNVPLEIAAEVADVAPEFVAIEQRLIDYANGAEPKSLSRFRQLRDAFQAAVETLGRRVTRAAGR